MKDENSPGDESRPAESGLALLERLTAAVLVAVLVVLGWIVVAAYQPAWLRLPSAEWEVVLVLVLLATALLLVSVVALLHTRR